MRTKPVTRSIAAAIAAMMLPVFGGCVAYDLGDFEDEEDYYNSFGDVELAAQGGSFDSYSVEDYFYNEKSVNDFAGSIVDSDEYIYFALPVTCDIVISSLALYAKSDKYAFVQYTAFITDNLPSDIRAYDDPAPEQEKDDEGNLKFDDDGNPIYDREYGDLDAETAISSGSFVLQNDEWGSFILDRWKQADGSTPSSITIAEDSYIIIRFENNSGLGKDEGLEKVSFSLTNLLVRAEEKNKNNSENNA